MPKTITIYASRNPTGMYTDAVTLSNYRPKRGADRSYGVNTNNQWLYWGPKDQYGHCWTRQLSREEERTLRLTNLKPGYCLNLTTGKETHISRATILR